MIDISDLDAAEVLVALHANARMQGNSFLAPKEPPLTVERAREVLANRPYVDYLHGRVMKIDFADEEIDPRLYDRGNGAGMAERTIARLRTEKAQSRIGEICDRNAALEADKRKAKQDAILASIPEKCRPATRENW